MRRGSLKETQMIEGYFGKRKPPRGTIVYEYPAVKRGSTNEGRWIDAIILVDEPTDEDERVIGKGDPLPSVEGKRVVVVQAKRRFGMSLMGQAFFSMKLMEECGATVVRSIALCAVGRDPVLERVMTEADERLDAVQVAWPVGPVAVSPPTGQ